MARDWSLGFVAVRFRTGCAAFPERHDDRLAGRERSNQQTERKIPAPNAAINRNSSPVAWNDPQNCDVPQCQITQSQINRWDSRPPSRCTATHGLGWSLKRPARSSFLAGRPKRLPRGGQYFGQRHVGARRTLGGRLRIRERIASSRRADRRSCRRSCPRGSRLRAARAPRTVRRTCDPPHAERCRFLKQNCFECVGVGRLGLDAQQHARAGPFSFGSASRRRRAHRRQTAARPRGRSCRRGSRRDWFRAATIDSTCGRCVARDSAATPLRADEQPQDVRLRKILLARTVADALDGHRRQRTELGRPARRRSPRRSAW